MNPSCVEGGVGKGSNANIKNFLKYLQIFPVEFTYNLINWLKDFGLGFYLRV